MARRYTPQEKQQVLQRLVANGCDIRLTNAQTGIPERTLSDWRSKYFPPSQQRQYIQGGLTLAESRQIPQLPANDLQALREIKRQLMDKINRLSHAIDQSIDEAPLIQRAAALSQFIDRVVKISAQIPPDPEDYRLEGVEGEEGEPKGGLDGTRR